ncbi:MAG: hypothetical protein JRN20_14720 [Nitrososphaerota archaeon]|nr:hypothetical protein [Nitrososphaerota archaeon]
MSRERVIVEIETLGDALKVEETIRTGYCDAIAENLVQWIAVEEDLASSYQKISNKSADPLLKKSINELVAESRENITILNSMLKSVEEFGKARDLREKQIERLAQSA